MVTLSLSSWSRRSPGKLLKSILHTSSAENRPSGLNFGKKVSARGNPCVTPCKMFILREETRHWSGGNYTPRGMMSERLKSQVAPSRNPEQARPLGRLKPFSVSNFSLRFDSCPEVTLTVSLVTTITYLEGYIDRQDRAPFHGAGDLCHMAQPEKGLIPKRSTAATICKRCSTSLLIGGLRRWRCPHTVLIDREGNCRRSL
jgi:hypothetical protein